MSANLVSDRDRTVSVVRLEGPLTAATVRAHLLGREAYRRSRYAVVRAGETVAVARLALADTTPLMSPVTDVELLAALEETAWVVDDAVDTGVPGQLAAAARAHAPAARCVVVHGRYGHVGFICDPRPLRVRVVDVVPPRPAKLADQARRVLDVADDLPPVELELAAVDLEADIAAHPRPTYLLPCRGGGVAGAADAAYLDERPPRWPWTLLGCERSRELHAWFYGDVPETIDVCPLVRRPADDGAPTLRKCCQLEHGTVVDGLTVTVPWGATLAEVRGGLEQLVTATERAWSPA
jgi:hypothetical protein